MFDESRKIFIISPKYFWKIIKSPNKIVIVLDSTLFLHSVAPTIRYRKLRSRFRERYDQSTFFTIVVLGKKFTFDFVVGSYKLWVETRGNDVNQFGPKLEWEIE